MTVQSALAQAKPCSAAMRDHLGQAASTLSAPSQTGSVSGKCRPRSPRPTAPEHGVGQRVAHGVGVAVAAQPARALDHDAARAPAAGAGSSENRWTSMPWPMRTLIPPRRQQALGRAQVVGVGDLEVAGLARARPARWRRAPRPAWRRRWLRSAAPRVGPAQDVGPEGLRRLHRDQRGAVERAR